MGKTKEGSVEGGEKKRPVIKKNRPGQKKKNTSEGRGRKGLQKNTE